MKRILLCLLVTFVFFVSACNNSDFKIDANAGPDQNVKTGDTVTLDGSESTTSTSLTLSYNWSFDSLPAQSNATLSDANAVKPTFVADIDGEYTLTLEVSDPLDRSSTDFVVVTATSGTTNATPVANAGTDQNVATGGTVTLDGSGTDADGDTLTYSWILAVLPASSTAILSDSTAQKPTFVADLDGNYVANLVVNDGTIDSATSSVTITATSPPTNAKPVAVASANLLNVTTGDTVTLDGSGSSDADGDSLQYSWNLNSVPSGSTAALSDTTAEKPTFLADLEGDYVAQLTVSDGTVDSTPDIVTITATTPTTPTGPVGTLDQTFDGDGVVLFDHTSGRASRGRDIVVTDTSGIAFVAGGGPNTVAGTRGSMYLWNYDASGSPVASFGNNNGIAVWNNPDGADGAASGYGIAFDDPSFGPNIYVTGESVENYNTTPIYSMAIWKFNPNGTPYTQFNGSGVVLKTGTLGGIRDFGLDIFVDKNLYVYVTGTSYPSGSTTGDMVVWKYNQNGVLDSTFGGGKGFVSHGNAAGGNNSDKGAGITLDSNGNIYVAGSSVGATSGNDMVVWKYTSSGQLDTTFGSGKGFAVYDNAAGGGTADAAEDLAIDSAGNIYVTGYSNSLSIGTNYDMVIWKLTSDGSLDTNFGNNGIVVDSNAAGGTTDSNDLGQSIVLDSFGNIYVTGYSRGPNNDDVVIWKYNPDGTPFAGFGNNGIVLYGGANQQQGLGLALQGNDHVFVTGVDNNDMTILKYE